MWLKMILQKLTVSPSTLSICPRFSVANLCVYFALHLLTAQHLATLSDNW